MPPLKGSRKHMREEENIFAPTMCRSKKPVIHIVEKVDGASKWNEMPHDILVDIMKRLGDHEKTWIVSVICKSWLFALLDSIFPPGDVLDLRLFDQIPPKSLFRHRIYGNYVWMVLNRRQYTQLFLPQRTYKKGLYEDIAKRLPTLKCLVVPWNFPVDFLLRLTGMFVYWPKLMEAHCHASPVRNIAINCKQIQKLWLYGWIRDEKAKWIAKKLPQLEHLDIQSCVLSSRALAIILDGQKELKHLDTRHAACFDDKFLSRYGGNPFRKAIDWNEEEICPKVAGVETYLGCPRKYCPDCSIFYDSSVSPQGLRAWFLHCKTSQLHGFWQCSFPSCILLRKPKSEPVVSCFLHEFGTILPANFRPVEDDLFLFALRFDRPEDLI